MNKIEIPRDKREWPLGLIPGLIVLISTGNKKGEPNIAPKSWIQMASFEPPVLLFSGSKGNTTENNIIETGSFAVNFVDSSMADKVFACIKSHGRERIERSGFELGPARTIDAPIVKDCKAHIECRLCDTKEVGSGYVIFGEIMRVAVDEEILGADRVKRYDLLDQILFLDDGLFGRLGDVLEIKPM